MKNNVHKCVKFIVRKNFQLLYYRTAEHFPERSRSSASFFSRSHYSFASIFLPLQMAKTTRILLEISCANPQKYI
jgi:hypothetical protein